MLAAVPDHDLLALSVPVKISSYSPRLVVVYTDLEMPEHFHLCPVVIEGSLATHGLVLHDRLRFLGCVLVPPEHLPRLGVASVDQPGAVRRDKPHQQVEQAAPVDEMCHLPRAVPGTVQDCAPLTEELLDNLYAIDRARLLSPSGEIQKHFEFEGAAVTVAGGGQPILQGLKLKVLPPQLVLCLLKIGLVVRELSFKA